MFIYARKKKKPHTLTAPEATTLARSHAQLHAGEERTHTAAVERQRAHARLTKRTDLQFGQNTVQDGQLAASADEEFVPRSQLVLVKQEGMVAHLPTQRAGGQWIGV